MRNVRRQRYPIVHLLLPNRSLRRREIPIVEAPYRDTKLIWTKIESPADRCAANRAEVVVQFASIWAVSGIDSVLAFEPNLRLSEIGVAGQRHACAPLTHLAVANGNSIRLALDNDTKSATLAARNPRHCKSPGVPNRARLFDYLAAETGSKVKLQRGNREPAMSLLGQDQFSADVQLRSAIPSTAARPQSWRHLRIRAIFRLMYRSKSSRYSITSSASASRDGGTSRPSTLAVLRLITNSNLVG